MSEPTEPTVFTDLTAEVAVPPDGTLSRVLFKDGRVRLVAFAFDQGQELTDHTAAVPVVIQVVSGSFQLRLGERVETITPGSWVHLPADVTHAVLAVEPGVLLLTMLPGA